MAQSARLGLPLLIPGQGQKDVTHNEALLSLDLLVQPVVRGRTTPLPPEAALEGECWLVPEDAEGAWAGKTHCIAGWTAGGWRFTPTGDGWSLWVADEAITVRVKGTPGNRCGDCRIRRQSSMSPPVAPWWMQRRELPLAH